MTRTPLKTKGICAFEFVDSKCRSSGKAISFLFPRYSRNDPLLWQDFHVAGGL